ncbi:MAG TPA: IS200/IS605 family transposase [Rhodopirellula baltica]|uniref:Probable transposase n=1 Tax=Rhodopirellula baltica (strain DSM 10527 / NCIMB 13988 / SH1) TaxID=243090 RepID=Q7US03_RHOBA|nr:IS200/IS605 family transposase [Rhodopirellula baltica]CAD74181.1 probable transposase [Rhodopirellula baltica SH 1]HBE61665.1 IS200/IS605 family transposase [Rhodopirellula baltica]
MAYTNLRVHLIWSTKDRKQWFFDEFQEELSAYIGGVLRKRKHSLLAAGGVEDHIHLLVSIHPAQSISDCVRDIKSNSSVWVHEHLTNLKSFQWQTKYGAFSVSESSVDSVKAYVANQKEHHKKLTFKEEFMAILRKHGIQFDPRYVFE